MSKQVLSILCCLLIVLTVAGNTWASYTWAYASISKTGHGSANDDDEDSSVGYCSSTATADCPLGACAAFAQTVATVSPHFGSGPMQIAQTSIDYNNQEPSTYTGHAFTNNGRAQYLVFNAKLIGDGISASLAFDLDEVFLRVPAGSFNDYRSIQSDVQVNQIVQEHGSFTLHGDGSVEYDTSGFWVESFFDVFYEPGTDTWNAEYIGAPQLSFDVPVGEEFELALNSEASGAGGFVEDGDPPLALGISIPEGYEFVPEPASLALLGLGGIAVLRRRRG